jgi:tetratricopeptide (TPR) repeat protein
MKSRLKLVTPLLLAAIAGCHSATQQQQADATARQQAMKDKFEVSHDPPIQAQTFFASGQLLQSQDRFDEALAQYKKALEITPTYLDAIYATATTYTQMKDFDNAITTWKKYVEKTGGSATAYNNLAFCEDLAGDPSAAEISYQRGIVVDPKNEPCHVNYGLMLARHGRANEGLAQLQMVLTPAKAHYDLASIYEQQGRLLEARAEYQVAIELDPKLQEANQRLVALSKD